jgi:hypothetical protein
MAKGNPKKSLMLSCGILLGICIGIASHYLGQVSGPMGVIFAPERLHEKDLGFPRLLLLILVLAYPMALGFAVGDLTWRLSRLFRFDEYDLVIRYAKINGAVVFGVHLLLSIIIYGAIRDYTQVLAAGFSRNGTPWWMYIVLIVEAMWVIDLTRFFSSREERQRISAKI